MAEKKTATIVLFSGDFDKVFAAFTIAIGTLLQGWKRLYLLLFGV